MKENPLHSPTLTEIAGENPNLAAAARQLDDHIERVRDQQATFTTDDVVRQLGIAPNQATYLLQKLASAGELLTDDVVVCPNENCLGFNRRDEIEDNDGRCRACDRPLPQPRPEAITSYRPGARTAAEPGPTAPNMIAPIKSGLTGGLPEQVASEPLPDSWKKDPFARTPLLRFYGRDESLGQGMTGKRCLFVLHFLADLIPFVEACRARGMDPSLSTFFFKRYPYPHRDDIEAWLRGLGAEVHALTDAALDDVLERLEAMSPEERGEVLVVEDGGYLVPRIHERFPSVSKSVIGAVEQTTAGRREADKLKEAGTLAFPVLSVASSQLKGSFEPPYVADAVIQNIRQLKSDRVLNGMAVAVVGYGAIGAQVAEKLRAVKAVVTVYDPESAKRLSAGSDGFTVTSTAGEAVEGKALVIGTTGLPSVTAQEMARMRHGVVLVSASSEQYEFDISWLERSAAQITGHAWGTEYELTGGTQRTVQLVANGYPINFWGADSLPGPVADLVMTLIFLAAAELAAGQHRVVDVNADAVNDIAKRYDIAGEYGRQQS